MIEVRRYFVLVEGEGGVVARFLVGGGGGRRGGVGGGGLGEEGGGVGGGERGSGLCVGGSGKVNICGRGDGGNAMVLLVLLSVVVMRS